jgi:hypothetical protein
MMISRLLFPRMRLMIVSRSSALQVRARLMQRKDSSSGCWISARGWQSSIRSGVWWGLRASADGSAAGYPVLNNAADFTAEQIATELFEGVTVEQVRRILVFARA